MIDFDNAIDNYLRRGVKQKKVGKYYPSEIGYCLRKLWFSYRYPKETDKELAKVFQMGNLIHDFIVDVLKSEKNPHIELVEKEMPISQEVEGFMINGRIDNLITLSGSGRKILVEVKSSGSLLMEKPKQEHVFQIQVYMDILKVNDGVILYVDKSKLRTKAFFLTLDEKVVKEAMARFKNLDYHLKTERIPRPEAKEDPSKGWMCSGCEYSKECGHERTLASFV